MPGTVSPDCVSADAPYCMSAAPAATSSAQPSRRVIEERRPDGRSSTGTAPDIGSVTGFTVGSFTGFAIGAEASPRQSSSAAGRRIPVTPMKTQRQPAFSTTTPVIAGPTMEGTTQAVAKIENTRGWSSAG